jgi:hypothetical protein
MEVLINGKSMKYQGNIMQEGDFSKRGGIIVVSLPSFLKWLF